MYKFYGCVVLLARHMHGHRYHFFPITYHMLLHLVSSCRRRSIQWCLTCICKWATASCLPTASWPISSRPGLRCLTSQSR